MKKWALLLISILVTTQTVEAFQRAKAWADQVVRREPFEKAQAQLERARVVSSSLPQLSHTVAELCQSYEEETDFIQYYRPFLIDSDPQSGIIFSFQAPEGKFALTVDKKGVSVIIADPTPQQEDIPSTVIPVCTSMILDCSGYHPKKIDKIINHDPPDKKLLYFKHMIRDPRIDTGPYSVPYFKNHFVPLDTVLRNKNTYHVIESRFIKDSDTIELRVRSIDEKLLGQLKKCDRAFMKTLNTVMDRFYHGRYVPSNSHWIPNEGMKLTKAEKATLDKQTDQNIKKMIQNFKDNCQISDDVAPNPWPSLVPESLKRFFARSYLWWCSDKGQKITLAILVITTIAIQVVERLKKHHA